MSNSGRIPPAESYSSVRKRTHRRVELCVLAVALLVACVAWWSTRGKDTGASVMVEVAARAPLASGELELMPPPAAANDATPSATRVPQTAKRASETVSNTLTIYLHNTHGSPFFDYVEAPDLDTAEALRLVYLEACPRVGLDLPSSARRLRHRSTDVRTQRLAQWMKTSTRPTEGWACVVLGERVLAAEPFGIAQTRLLLTVNPADLVGVRCTLQVLVVDDQRLTPIQGARVVLKGQHRKRELLTDWQGAAGWQDLIPGDVSIQVSHAGYRFASRTVAFAPGQRSAVETIQLARMNSISGTVRWSVANPPAARVVLLAVDAMTPKFRVIEIDPRGWSGTFRFEDLRPGEYIVGLDTGFPHPSADQVKHREVEGWTFVNARFGDVADVWINVTPTMPAPEPVPSPRR